MEKGGKFVKKDNVNLLLINPTPLKTHPQDVTRSHLVPSFHPVWSKHILRETSKENVELQIQAHASTFILAMEGFLNA